MTCDDLIRGETMNLRLAVPITLSVLRGIPRLGTTAGFYLFC